MSTKQRSDYRVNFGNGQVHYAGSVVDCLRFKSAFGDGFTFIEKRDDETGDWFKIRFTNKYASVQQ